MRLVGAVLGAAVLLAEPSVVLAQGPDMSEVVERSRAPFCEAVSAELGVNQQACESFLDVQEVQFMVVDLDVYTEMVSDSSPLGSHSSSNDAPVTFSSDGTMNTAPFQLLGGDYHVDIETAGDCYYSFHLEGDNAGFRPSLSQSSYVYDVAPGRYYWWVNTGPPPNCGWELTMEPS